MTRRLIGSRRSALLIAVVIAGLASAFGTSSASPAQDPPVGMGGSPNDLFPPDDSTAIIGPTGLSSTSYVGKAKVAIEVPATYALVYFLPNDRAAESVRTPPAYYLPKHPKAGCTYQFSSTPTDAYVADMTQSDPSHAAVRSVGAFPDTHVSMLAFGSIPVTATLHVRQLFRNGKIVPLSLDAVGTAFSLEPGSGAVGCDPDWESSVPQPTTADGQLRASVSDVQVDGHPVDVGTNCNAIAPLDVRLIGRQPTYPDPFHGGTLIQRADRSVVRDGENAYPLYPESHNLVIPSFSGCRSRSTGEDVSRLVTTMVSGPENSLTVSQSEALLNATTREDPSLCYPPGTDTMGGALCAAKPKNPPALAPGN